MVQFKPLLYLCFQWIRSIFIYFFMVSGGDFSFVRNREVSVIVGCPQGGSWLYILVTRGNFYLSRSLHHSSGASPVQCLAQGCGTVTQAFAFLHCVTGASSPKKILFIITVIINIQDHAHYCYHWLTAPQAATTLNLNSTLHAYHVCNLFFMYTKIFSSFRILKFFDLHTCKLVCSKIYNYLIFLLFLLLLVMCLSLINYIYIYLTIIPWSGGE